MSEKPDYKSDYKEATNAFTGRENNDEYLFCDNHECGHILDPDNYVDDYPPFPDNHISV
jgi:hypothetical protein